MEWVRCCKCDKDVRLPSADWHVHVRCPHCGASYPLEEILNALPPLLEVVPSPAPTILVPEHGPAPRIVTGELPEESTVLEERPLPRPHIQEPTDPRVLMPSPMKLDALRKKPMSKRLLGSFVKITLGGVAGLLIGQLILWWLPPPYRTDPLDLAPRLPAQLSFLAPPNLRDPIFDLNGADGDFDPSIDEVALEENPSPAPPSQSETPSTGTSNTIPQAPDGSDPAAERNIVLGLADAPQIAMPELESSLLDAKQALPATDADFEPLYNQLAKLAYNVTFADIEEPNIGVFASSVESFLVEVAAEPTRLDKIAAQATIAIGEGDAVDRQGVLVVGTMKGLAKVGQLFQSEIAMRGAESAVVPVISHADPIAQGVYQLEDRVLIMGVVVHDPSLHLLGYRGGADVVVLGGLPLKLP